MPKTTISACPVELNGCKQFRVCVPKTLQVQYGAARKFFRNRKDAEDFADTLNKSRQGWSARFLALADSTQGDLLYCFDLCGGDMAMLKRAAAVVSGQKVGTQKKMREAINECTHDKARAGKSEGFVNYLKCAANGLELAHEGCLVSDVTREWIETHLHSNGWSGTTQRGMLNHLITFFNWCRGKGFCASNPAKMATKHDPDGIQRPASTAGPIRCLTVEQAAKLLKVAYDTDRGMVSFFALGLFMGGRVAELQRLEVGEVRQDAVQVAKHKAKTKQRRVIEPEPVLKAWLQIESGLQWRNRENRRAKIAQLAGVEWFPGALRHSFCSYALPKLGAGVTSYLAGNSEGVLRAHYTAMILPSEWPKYWALFPETVLTPNVTAMPAAA